MTSVSDQLTSQTSDVANSTRSLVSVSISTSSGEKTDRLTSSTVSVSDDASTDADKCTDDELRHGLWSDKDKDAEEVDLSITPKDVTKLRDTRTMRQKMCGSTAQMVYGVVLLICSVASFIWTPLDVLMAERLRMTPGFPAYEWWVHPPDEVLLRLYVFNITNHREFLSGESKKLNVQEIGPIVYREKLRHLNPRFNDNSTLTYTAQRTAIFLPEYNQHIDMNATIFLPNLAVLGMSSYLHDVSFFVKLGFKMMINSDKSPVIVKSTIYNYLWNYTDPLLDTAQSILPSLVPVNNMGILHRIYSDFNDENNVFIGGKYGDSRFFQLASTHGSSRLPGYPASCPDEVTNSTEGVMYQQRITKETVLYYWRKTICRVIPLTFDDEVMSSKVLAYRFNLSEHVFDRTHDDNSMDCYRGSPALKDGLSDVSACYYDFPVAASLPHFYAGDPAIQEYVSGLQPDKNKHGSYVLIEPLTGVPLEGCARSQSNLVINPLSGFGDDIDKFSDTIIPMFWAEYNQVSVPNYIYNLVFFTANVVPILQNVVRIAMLLLGLIVTAKSCVDQRKENSSPLRIFPLLLSKEKLDNLARNTMLSFERETFLNKVS